MTHRERVFPVLKRQPVDIILSLGEVPMDAVVLKALFSELIGDEIKDHLSCKNQHKDSDDAGGKPHKAHHAGGRNWQEGRGIFPRNYERCPGNVPGKNGQVCENIKRGEEEGLYLPGGGINDGGNEDCEI